MLNVFSTITRSLGVASLSIFFVLGGAAVQTASAQTSCPTSGPGVACFGGQVYNPANQQCVTPPTCGAYMSLSCGDVTCRCNFCPANGTSNCTDAYTSTIGQTCSAPINGKFTSQCGACSCPSGTTICSASNTCVNNLACPTGTTFDPCTNSCSTPNILKDQGTAQSAYINITGDITSTAGNIRSGSDVYIPTGKAIRVDAAGVSTLNIGNYGAGGTDLTVNLRGNTVVAPGVPGKYMAFFSPLYRIQAEAGLEFHTYDHFRWIRNGSESMRLNSSGQLGVGTNPQYPLDIRSAAGTANMRLMDGVGNLWTGTVLARGTSEKWFVGMNGTDDTLRFRSNGTTDVGTLTSAGKLTVSSLQVSGGTPGAGKILSSTDTNGNLAWVDASAVGGACSNRQYVGQTPGEHDGLRGGYKAADLLCNAAFAGSSVCTVEEVMNSYKCGGSAISSATGIAWLNGGPPGYNASSNDCVGWTSNSGAASVKGRVWSYDNSTGGTGFLSFCDNGGKRKFSCCK